MEIRKIQMEDAYNYLDMLLKLDNETKFMMFEPGERPTDINIAKHLYEKNGFEVEGIKRNAMIIDDEYVDEFSMAKIYMDNLL